MIPDPPVAVVIPLFNRRHSILEAVDSALQQTYPAVEVVVVDDGSSDGGGDLVQARAETDARIRVLFQENRGPSSARNVGIAATRAPFITFLDSDDLMVPDRIRSQMDYLTSNPDIDAVIGQERDEITPGITPPRIVQLNMRREEPEFCAMSILLPRNHLEQIGGFDESIGIAEDADLLVRLRAAGVRIGRLEKIVMVRRIFGDNLTYNLTEADIIAVFRKHLEARRG